ncbi:DUF2835 domain-containing protein [Pseudoalteromonas tunicata]|jgi:hypothetical protein|uniref:Uncharacterized protein n=1 Tax=Pseudoalteromonas tunicata D2 TaxID=87626 RepID=A4CC85_9GAMM|nr:DUF2835 domain-containing protein [Pseudoalteromonas tunicata]AXT30247.1 DUF2835 family protein [Pseudoalteromonas tunicata]EAR27972.1 hypothetical protein PTD2_19160 [Pseudoalteromonas tunicata D2]MDP4984856.1 DUF2835 domain-containing protein [Pseudoalteromonas tunicata]MDP5212178.1 DUF2835 domain-containing protein [Pseudoalteromonas tunicata]
MFEFFFTINLSYEKCLGYYHGTIKQIQVTSDEGKKIRLPAERFRPFITSIGIRGRYRLRLTETHQFISLEKIG